MPGMMVDVTGGLDVGGGDSDLMGMGDGKTAPEGGKMAPPVEETPDDR